MKVAVVGSRGFDDYKRLKHTLDSILAGSGFDTIVSGGARGADSLGARYADEKGIKKIIHLPDWEMHGKAAGFIRNKDIIDDADFIVACWDGVSRGTSNSLALAKEQKKDTLTLYY
jgi:hypothetical protein